MTGHPLGGRFFVASWRVLVPFPARISGLFHLVAEPENT
ncbi:hypothetical protein AAur_2148 [Paenarthrobacter aurescens TC1]|uniref:Uncharacterized protein n=1 Tax=Paenarthrobacter aurescens (strain TC1) TaxID=290340 RepID=A1R6M8_PAEAT|nr:hypothetical protein AAur_2148 [Paenarthrobacter aurescens TC1]